MSVVFRRIGGRVVPIRSGSTSDAKKIKVGAAEVAAGLAVAVGGGVGAAKVVKVASSMVMKGRTLFKYKSALARAADPMAAKGLRQGAKAARELVKSGRALYKVRNPIIAATSLVSAGLLAAGAEKINAGMNHRPEKSGAFKYISSAGVAGALTGAAYYRALPVKGFTKIAINAYHRMHGKTGPFKAPWWNP